MCCQWIIEQIWYDRKKNLIQQGTVDLQIIQDLLFMLTQLHLLDYYSNNVFTPLALIKELNYRNTECKHFTQTKTKWVNGHIFQSEHEKKNPLERLWTGVSDIFGCSVWSLMNSRLHPQIAFAWSVTRQMAVVFITLLSLSQSMLSCYLTVGDRTAWGTHKQQNRLEVACTLWHLLCFAVFLLSGIKGFPLLLMNSFDRSILTARYI